jgi:hypothetical protein
VGEAAGLSLSPVHAKLCPSNCSPLQPCSTPFENSRRALGPFSVLSPTFAKLIQTHCFHLLLFCFSSLHFCGARSKRRRRGARCARTTWCARSWPTSATLPTGTLCTTASAPDGSRPHVVSLRACRLIDPPCRCVRLSIPACRGAHRCRSQPRLNRILIPAVSAHKQAQKSASCWAQRPSFLLFMTAAPISAGWNPRSGPAATCARCLT